MVNNAGRALVVNIRRRFSWGYSFERQDDAARVMDVLHKRMGRFGQTLHPDKTRLLPFGRPPKAQTGGKGPGTFDLLEFTLYWGRTRQG
jgi:RNA-directed DNA polymerase